MGSIVSKRDSIKKRNRESKREEKTRCGIQTTKSKAASIVTRDELTMPKAARQAKMVTLMSCILNRMYRWAVVVEMKCGDISRWSGRRCQMLLGRMQS